jgi:hypothetical protein
MNGAVGENRTHDLSLTKGLRYHYATTATVVFPDFKPEPLTRSVVRERCYNVRIPRRKAPLFDFSMVKRPPEKLAQALRANLRRRKQPPGSRAPEPGPPPPADSAEPAPETPPEKSA